SLAAAVLYSLLPPEAHIGFVTLLGAYAAAVVAGIISHVPGGIGVFEAVILLALPNVPPDALLGSLLAYRAVSYLVPSLFRRVQAAYHISFWLLVAGSCASLLKGLDFEEAIILALVLGVLTLGRRAFYRPTAILSERFTPVWVVSIAGVIVLAVWIGFVSY